MCGRQGPRGNSAAFSTQQPDWEYLKEEAREFGAGGILALTLGPQSLGGYMGQNFREPSPLLMSSLPSPHTLTWHPGTQRPICLFITAPNWHRGPGPKIILALLLALLTLPSWVRWRQSHWDIPGEEGGKQDSPSERSSQSHPGPCHLALVRGSRAECTLCASLFYGS